MSVLLRKQRFFWKLTLYLHSSPFTFKPLPERLPGQSPAHHGADLHDVIGVLLREPEGPTGGAVTGRLGCRGGKFNTIHDFQSAIALYLHPCKGSRPLVGGS